MTKKVEQMELARKEPADVALAPVTQTPGELLRIAVESNADVDKLERLMALQERWEATQARKAYYKAMRDTQEEIQPVVRDANNQQTRSNYTRLETMHKAISPIYTKHGFSVSHDEADSPHEGMTRYVALCRHIDGHSETTHIDLPLDDVGMQGKPNKTKVHAKASSSSYARRILEARIFNVVFGGDDDDGNAAGAAVIDDKQMSTLLDWIDSTGTPIESILNWGKVKSLELFPAKMYDEAIRTLQAKAKKARQQA